MGNDLIIIGTLLRDVVIALVAIGTYEHGKKAINQWLRERRGTDKHEIGKELKSILFDLEEAILNIRTYGESDSHLLEIQQQILANSRKFGGKEIGPFSLELYAKCRRAREILERFREVNRKARVLGEDFSDDADFYDTQIETFEAAHLVWTLSDNDQQKKTSLEFLESDDDDLRFHIEQRTHAITAKVDQRMVNQE